MSHIKVTKIIIILLQIDNNDILIMFKLKIGSAETATGLKLVYFVQQSLEDLLFGVATAVVVSLLTIKDIIESLRQIYRMTLKILQQ